MPNLCFPIHLVGIQSTKTKTITKICVEQSSKVVAASNTKESVFIYNYTYLGTLEKPSFSDFFFTFFTFFLSFGVYCPLVSRSAGSSLNGNGWCDVGAN